MSTMKLHKVVLLGQFAWYLSGCASTRILDSSRIKTEADESYRQGHYAAAIEKWQSISTQTDSGLLFKQAQAYRNLGQIKQAQFHAERALDAASPDEKGELLLGLGELAMMQGLKPAALTYLQSAEPFTSQQPELSAKQAVLEARIALVDGNSETALALLLKAQQFAGQANDRLLQQSIAVDRWVVLFESRAPKSGLKLDRPTWQLDSEELTALQATVTAVSTLPASANKDILAIKLARLLVNLPTQASAAEHLLASAALSCRQRDDQGLLSYALGYQGLLAERQGHDPEALELTAQAAFAAQQADAPESLYRWEWQTANINQRQQQPEAALAAYRRAVFNLQSVRPDIGTGDTFREKVAPLFVDFSDLLLRQARNQTDPQKSGQILTEVRNLLEQLKAAELQDYFQDRCVADFKTKNIGLEQINPRTAVLYPVLLADRTELLVGFSDGLRQYVVPIGKQQLTDEVHDFRRMLEKRTTFQYLRPAKQLYQWLIQPILADLHQHQIDTLVLVPDGALRNIPLAALYDQQHYLIQEFAIATTPGLALTDPHPLPEHQIQVLLTGLTGAVQQFSALPDVAQELDNIASQFGGTILKDQDFSLAAMERAMQDHPYRIVHIASHGQFDQNPRNTFLLTYDSKLTMNLLERYISKGKFRQEPVELLSLSACQTAVGDDRAALGLAGVAVKAGARSALASLWFINDQAASQLVSNFYRLLNQHVSKAEALQQAQLELMADPRYRHPSYWAPFLIIGNWL